MTTVNPLHPVRTTVRFLPLLLLSFILCDYFIPTSNKLLDRVQTKFSNKLQTYCKERITDI